MTLMGSSPDHETVERARAVTRRAVRRLDFLEWIIFIVGAALSVGGGLVLAWMVTGFTGWDFRWTWIGASLMLFVGAGGAAVLKIRKDAREDARRLAAIRGDDDG